MRTTVSKLTLVSAALVTLVGCGPKDANITAQSSANEIYNQTCAGCHEGGLKGWLTGAPQTGDKEAWTALHAKGIEAMTAASIQGFEKMPAKGSCEKCSDDQIKATVEYMAAQSK
jgi:cytochrome c5